MLSTHESYPFSEETISQKMIQTLRFSLGPGPSAVSLLVLQTEFYRGSLYLYSQPATRTRYSSQLSDTERCIICRERVNHIQLKYLF